MAIHTLKRLHFAPFSACLLLSGLFLLFSAKLAAAAETAFTYQGRLQEFGQPITGSFDLRLTLFDAPFQGTVIAGPVTNGAVPISQGIFNTSIDFGLSPFTGAPRFLEIAIRTNRASGDFVRLTPRQVLTPTPYAIFASRADTASSAAMLTDGGAALTNVPAARLVGTVPLASLSGITGFQLNAATDQLYRAGNSNRIMVINVRDYGAKGDGVTDDTKAIADAWNAFITSGATLYFPPGTYLDSGTHTNNSAAPVASTYFHDGRLILGLGNAQWKYTGSTRLLRCYFSSPDIDGIEFIGNPSAQNCIYITEPQGKIAIRNCFFTQWTGTSAGALVLDEADSVSLVNCYAFQCNIGFGLGFRCNNLRADVQTYACNIGVAIGVPTERFPLRRESHNIDLNIMSLYCSNGVALDGGSASTTIRGYFWNNTNSCVMIDCIPGISTNFERLISLTLDHSYFQGADYFDSPIKLYGGLYRGMKIEMCRFDQSANSRPLIKSYEAGGDSVAIEWGSNFRSGTRPVFEDSTGKQLAELGGLQHQFINNSVGVYNWRSQLGRGGSGFLLDVVDGSFQGPVARVGVSSQPDCRFEQFLGGLVVQYDASTGVPEVAVTNASFVVSGPGKVASSTAPGKPGMIRWDADYVYVCIAPNQWKRAALTSW